MRARAAAATAPLDAAVAASRPLPPPAARLPPLPEPAAAHRVRAAHQTAARRVPAARPPAVSPLAPCRAHPARSSRARPSIRAALGRAAPAARALQCASSSPAAPRAPLLKYAFPTLRMRPAPPAAGARARRAHVRHAAALSRRACRQYAADAVPGATRAGASASAARWLAVGSAEPARPRAAGPRAQLSGLPAGTACSCAASPSPLSPCGCSRRRPARCPPQRATPPPVRGSTLALPHAIR